MARRSFGYKGFRVEIEVPARVAAAVRRVRRPKATDKPRPTVEFLESIPALRLDDPRAALEKYMRELGRSLEWLPDGWAPAQVEGESLADQVKKLFWYHTIELPGGVTTPGNSDHRPLVPHYGIPADLRGKRVLDIGTWDGFWAFEFERRGAEVTALDIDRLTQTDIPPALRKAVAESGLDQPLGAGFEIASRARGSTVKRVSGSVYDLDPDEIGTFDLVHFADVSLHLERPLEAFRKIRSVTAGTAMIVDAIHMDLDADTDRNLTEYLSGWTDVVWWTPSLNTFAQMVLDAGFANVKVHRVYRLNPRVAPGPGRWRAILIASV